MSETVFGVPTEEQLAKINRFTRKPFKAEEVFVFRLKMIGNAMIPGRHMLMHESLLKEFAKNGENGDVAYMLNHQWADWFSSPKGVMNKGRVFHSWVEECHDLEGETHAQFAEVYIPRDKVKDGVSTNEIIESIEDGSLRDHSVGVGWSLSECSICGRDVWKDAKCEHYPGMMYDGKQAYVIAKPPGDEFEVSGVFAGAYPTAEVMSEGEGKPSGMEEVTDLAALKGMDPTTRVFALFGKDSVRILVPQGAFKEKASFSIAPTTAQEGGEKVEGEKKEGLEQAPVDVEATATSKTDVSVTLSVKDEVGIVLDRKVVVEAFGRELGAEEILRLAKDGQTLKADLLEDVLEWGVRADGNAFARETFAEMLTTASVEQLRKFRESFQTKAKEALKSGRETAPMDKQASKSAIPDAAYKA